MPLSDRDKRTLRIGGIVAGVLLVGVLAMSLLSGGDEELPPTTATRPDVTVSPSTTPTTDEPLPPAPVFTGRDPFSAPPGFNVTTSGTTTTPGGTTTTPGGTTTTPGGTNPPTQPGNGSSTNVAGHQVVLLDVFAVSGVGAVQVEVDGQVYNVTVGEEFGPGSNFELRSTSGNCASFRYGDESFTLCVTPEK
ncbi:MAG TPA: hypothetical protein VE032_11605 [Actinomycetota bacterium]|nr:hypothetical protein [Actinomycetota bacterium]